MTLVHEIKTIEDIKILCTCPACLKSLVDNEKITDGKERKLLTYDKQKLLIEDKMKKGNDQHEIVCPHCKRFHMIYLNRLNKDMRNVTEEKILSEE